MLAKLKVKYRTPQCTMLLQCSVDCC